MIGNENVCGDSSWRIVTRRIGWPGRTSKENPKVAEVVGTILIAKDHDTVIFLSGQHDNLNPTRNEGGKIRFYTDRFHQVVTQEVVENEIASALPPLAQYKPDGLYQIVNFAFQPEFRGGGLGKRVLLNIMAKINNAAVDRTGAMLFPNKGGWGFWQVGEPPWQKRMKPMNFHADPSQHVYLIPEKFKRWTNCTRS